MGQLWESEQGRLVEAWQESQNIYGNQQERSKVNLSAHIGNHDAVKLYGNKYQRPFNLTYTAISL